jgi:hypothetical protein
VVGFDPVTGIPPLPLWVEAAPGLEVPTIVGTANGVAYSVATVVTPAEGVLAAPEELWVPVVAPLVVSVPAEPPLDWVDTAVVDPAPLAPGVELELGPPEQAASSIMKAINIPRNENFFISSPYR